MTVFAGFLPSGYVNTVFLGRAKDSTELLARFTLALHKHLLIENFAGVEWLICDKEHSQILNTQIFVPIFEAILENTTNPKRFSIAASLDTSLSRCSFTVGKRLDSSFSNLCRAACLIQQGELFKASEEIAFLENLAELKATAINYTAKHQSGSMVELFTLFLDNVNQIALLGANEAAKPAKYQQGDFLSFKELQALEKQEKQKAQVQF